MPTAFLTIKYYLLNHEFQYYITHRQSTSILQPDFHNNNPMVNNNGGSNTKVDNSSMFDMSSNSLFNTQKGGKTQHQQEEEQEDDDSNNNNNNKNLVRNIFNSITTNRETYQNINLSPAITTLKTFGGGNEDALVTSLPICRQITDNLDNNILSSNINKNTNTPTTTVSNLISYQKSPPYMYISNLYKVFGGNVEISQRSFEFAGGLSMLAIQQTQLTIIINDLIEQQQQQLQQQLQQANNNDMNDIINDNDYSLNNNNTSILDNNNINNSLKLIPQQNILQPKDFEPMFVTSLLISLQRNVITLVVHHVNYPFRSE
eukprot:UN01496